jgi:methionyl-tRNA formyltransferase
VRLAFLGTPDFAAATLGRLIAAGHDIACAYAQPPRPAGRGQQPVPSPVEGLARDHGIEVRTPARLRDEAEIERFAALDLDAAIVAAYGLILPQKLLDAPRLGCFNVHASLLPRWRGAAPIQRAILAGDAETGITIMRMEAGLDTGPMLARATLPIGPETTGGALHDALATLGADLMAETLPRIADGVVTEIPQPDDGVTYAAKIDKAELAVDWARPAVLIERQIRAFAPRPAAHAEHDGERIKILAAVLAPGSGAPGSVLDDRLTIACGEGALRLTRLQRPGRAPLDAETLLRGWRVARGHRFA